MKRKRFIKLLMGKLLLTRNEANYIADVTGETFYDDTKKGKTYCCYECQQMYWNRQAAQRYRDRKAAERAAVSNGR